MMDGFQIDARRWRFLDNPARYIEHESGGLQVEPLTRQFKTAKEILARLASGRGVLLADDVGLGKTTVGALVAWVVACQDKRVRIYAPNEVLRRRWAEELERHVPMLSQLGASYDRIKQGDVGKLNAGRIQVATHHALVKSHGNNEQRTACDLMIIDEAHRAKGDGSAFNEALRNLGDRAKRKLILTATPFSIRLAELEQLLQFAGATELEAVRRYAGELKRLYSLGDGHDVTAESKRLVSAAKEAIEELQPYLIRHGIEDLSASERKHFGAVAMGRWEIPTAPATQEDLGLLLRMDRLLQLTPERKGERRNDPRFHIGWQHVGVELERAAERASDSTARRHIEAASKALRARRTKPHPKIAAVSDAIRPLLDAGEKVLVFCHHRATASELLGVLERALKTTSASRGGPPEKVWRAAWESLLPDEDPLVRPIINWLCTPGLRAQISRWLGEPALTVRALADQLTTTRPRNAMSSVPTVFESARTLTEVLLDQQSTSTRALLKSIAKGAHTFGGKTSHFPGRLDDGFRVMGAWHHDGHSDPPRTLYTGKPDIVLALFNSPFGPDVLVTTDRLSEGVDLHRCCRHLIHYELDPSPVRTLQRNGRVRRVGSWAALTGQPIQYAYPTFGGTRDEKAVGVMRQRINAFGLLLGGVPSLDDDASDSEQSFAEAVLRGARKDLASLNRRLCV
jgi:hypothetical protein